MSLNAKKLLDDKVYDRIMKSANFEEGDRVPIWDYIDNSFVYDYFSSKDEPFEQRTVKVFHGLGIDLCRGFTEPILAELDGTKRQFENKQQVISGQTVWTERPIKTIEDLKKFNIDLVKKEWIYDKWIPNLKRMQEIFAPYTMFVPGVGVGFDDLYSVLMDLELFSFAIYDEPEHIKKILNRINENRVQLVQAIIKENLSPIFFTWSDIAYKGSTMFSKKILQEFFIPCLKNICKPLKEAGIKIIFHSDGNVMNILDDMIDAGIDGLNPIEPIAGMDIGYLKKKYYRKLILVGNVDCSQVLPFGTKKDLINATKECIRQASIGGGHFIGSSSEIVPSTPLENVLTFYNACHKYGKYPINLQMS